jgi:hypothetical protein
MKLHLVISLLFLSITKVFSQTNPPTNHFADAQDTLILNSIKVKGPGIFDLGAGGVHFKDTVALRQTYPWFNFTFSYPADISGIELSFIDVMITPYRYYSIKGKAILQQNTGRGENVVGLMAGTLDQQKIYILDQNKNRDFRDDTVRFFQKMRWKNPDNLLVFRYRIDKGEEIITDSSWAQIGLDKDRIWCGSFQHQVASCVIGDQPYRLGIADSGADFSYYRPILAVLAENGVTRDSLLYRDNIGIGQYLKLGHDYYKFTDFFNGSGTIVLVRDDNYTKRVGAQVGLLVPNFQFKTVIGDTLTSTKFKNKFILIANVTSCGPESFTQYEEILKSGGKELTIIGLNYGIKKGLNGMMVDVTDYFNEGIYKNFRNSLSSYDCYLINKEGRVIDKFWIQDWKTRLSPYLKSIELR